MIWWHAGSAAGASAAAATGAAHAASVQVSPGTTVASAAAEAPQSAGQVTQPERPGLRITMSLQPGGSKTVSPGAAGAAATAPGGAALITASATSAAAVISVPNAASGVAQDVRAFPGAEGFGAGATGGRGGSVIKVTNLNNSGTGSLRTALTTSGPRIVVFEIGGTIQLSSSISITSGDLTVAGQTAPGGGITVAGATVSIEASNVIMRGMRFRNGTTSTSSSRWDVLAIYGPEGTSASPAVTDIIIDRCSMSWGIDENLTTYGKVSDVTMSWCIVSECLYLSVARGVVHSMGSLVGSYSDNISYHHNINAHNNQRNPRVQGTQVLEVVNNVVYNYGQWGSQVDQGVNAGTLGPLKDPHINYVRNYYKVGPDSSANRHIRLTGPFAGTQLVYTEGNFTPTRTSAAQAEFDCIANSSTEGAGLERATPWPASAYPVTATAYPDFLTDVYATAGAPNRDSVDTRIVADVQAGTGGMIDDPSEVGGWPSLAAGSPPTDTDNDGIPDSWALTNGVTTANGIAPSGYTWIEEYINSLL